jgi:hypothetical protein
VSFFEAVVSSGSVRVERLLDGAVFNRPARFRRFFDALLLSAGVQRFFDAVDFTDSVPVEWLFDAVLVSGGVQRLFDATVFGTGLKRPRFSVEA